MGTEAGMLAEYDFQGMVLGEDSADDAGKMGAGFCCLQKGNVKGCIRVGREQEGTSSSRPELAALEIALRQIYRKARRSSSLRQSVSIEGSERVAGGRRQSQSGDETKCRHHA